MEGVDEGESSSSTADPRGAPQPAMEGVNEGAPSASTPDTLGAQQPAMEGESSSSTADPRGAPQPAMEMFQGVEFVRLRNLVHGTYVYAAKDGRSVRLDARRESHNAVWAVQRHDPAGDGEGRVLFRGAYGRYLGGPDALLSSRVGAVQRDFDELETLAIMWRAVAMSGGAVLLQDAFGRFLHVKSRCLRRFRGVYVSTGDSGCTARQWVVEAVPRSTGLPLLPFVLYDNIFYFLGHVFTCTCSLLELCFLLSKRQIRYVLADDSGNFSEERWSSFQYNRRNAYQLERNLVLHLPVDVSDRVTLCIRAGRHGQLSPLMIDLPRSREPLYIVLVMEGTAAADELAIPDVDHGRDNIGVLGLPSIHI